MSNLQLAITNYVDATRWRWVLSDASGHFVADHTVRLDPTSRQYIGWLDLGQYLDYNTPINPPERQLRDLGVWIGEQVFGGLRETLWQRRRRPALAVHVAVPAAAQDLLLRPFELACFADGQSFREAGVRFVYALEDASPPATDKEPQTQALRILAAFSLPVAANPLNLRRERYALQRMVRELNQTQGLAVQLRVLQYGASRETLQEALEEVEGWDIIHLSGHGEQGGLLLEDERGGSDAIDAGELGDLLDLARARLKLLILDACYSGAGSHAAARAQVGLDEAPMRQEGAEGEALAETAQLALPSLAQTLSQRLACAALAMRYPVGDAFATELMLALYEKLLDKRRPLPGALHLALDDALDADIPLLPLAPMTPILVGPLAAELQLTPPAAAAIGITTLPTVGLRIGYFPEEPPRFVGRLQPMLRASQALALRSAKRGVLFYGMPGAGKTACALELAYRHEHRRFAGGYVWHRGPEADSDIAGSLFNLMQDIQTQLNEPDLGLTTALDEPARFRRYILPRLRALLQQKSLLLVLDNLEPLLTESNQWRDRLWGEVVATLLDHSGPSRVVLTSRRAPAGLAENPAVQVEAIHALSFAESVLLARELPNLNRLFDDDEGLALLRETLRVVQGHPKLLELADSLAADRAALENRVKAAADELANRADVLDAFFAVGGPLEGETRQSDLDYVPALRGWTAGVAGRLSSSANLLFAFLCRLEPEDRRQDVVAANWQDFLDRLGEENAAAVAALDESENGLPAALASLQAAGLVAVAEPDPELAAQFEVFLAGLTAQEDTPADLDPAALLAALQAQATTFTIHPGVAETVRGAAEPAVLDAADIELGDYHIAGFQKGLENELEGGGAMVVESGRRGASYLLRQARWQEASVLLERMLQRDDSPTTLAFALPLLRRIVDATAGSKEGVENAGVLASTLWKAGRAAEAEAMMRDVIAQAAASGEFRTASAVAGDLLNLLRTSGRLGEALQVAEERAGDTRQAGLGPWTQLADEGMRLQVLAAMGRYDEVLKAVDALRPHMDALPLESEAEEAINPWNVRESLLDTGRRAAVGLGRWEDMLTLTAEILKAKEARGASKLEIAGTRFNDYVPLLRLGRHDDTRNLLLDCRAVFEAERVIPQLGRVYGALADLEDETGGQAEAVRWQEVALGYIYQAGEPEDCASSHNNLAGYLEGQKAEPAVILAHGLADAVICYQTQSGTFATTLRNLANADLTPSPPAFAEVVARVEQVEGVRFSALFERLPRTAPDGDAAIAAVWQLVGEEKGRREEARQNREEVLAALPASVRAAFDLEGEAFGEALQEALAEMPEEEAGAILQQLQEADLIDGGSAGPDIAQVLADFESLLQAIAAAVGNESLRAEVEPVVADGQEKGWMLLQPVQRIWAGERDADTLTEHLDEQDSALVHRIIELVAQREQQATVLASLPESVRAVFDLEGEAFGEALQAALAELPEGEVEAILQHLHEAGLIGSDADGPEVEQVPQEFEPLLLAIAASVDDESARPAVEPVLADLEEKGWMLREPVQRIWAGERDMNALTAGLDSQDGVLIRQILELIVQ